MRLIIALGGNALLLRGEKLDASIQLTHVEVAARALGPLVNDHEVVICHGNGPQVGLLALESEGDPALTKAYPLDALGTQTQGMIGYWLIQSLHNAGVTKPLASLVTQVVVATDDPAFGRPSKLIGATYDEAQARRLAARHGWSIARDGPSWRRVVPSPEPVRIVEHDIIEQLLSSGSALIAGGGGGAPVTQEEDGQLRGQEAVIDKDLTAALLAQTLGADRLIILTDVAAVMTDYGTPSAAELRDVTLDELAEMSFPAGSMAPKIEACRRFVAATGNTAAIGRIADAPALLSGTAGTQISATVGRRAAGHDSPVGSQEHAAS